MALSNLLVDESVKKSLLERWTNMRESQRVAAKVKLLVEYDEGQTQRHINAITVDVSNSGCKAVVAGDLRLSGSIAAPRLDGVIDSSGGTIRPRGAVSSMRSVR